MSTAASGPKFSGDRINKVDINFNYLNVNDKIICDTYIFCFKVNTRGATK